MSDREQQIVPGAIWRRTRRGEEDRTLRITHVLEFRDGRRVEVVHSRRARRGSLSVDSLLREYVFEGMAEDE